MKRKFPILLALTIIFVSLWSYNGFASPRPAGTPIYISLKGVPCGGHLAGLQRAIGKYDFVSDIKSSMSPPHFALTLDESRMSAGEFVALVAATLKKLAPGEETGAALVLRVASGAGQPKLAAASVTEITKALKGIAGVTDVGFDETGKIVSMSFAQGAKVSTADISAALEKSPGKFTAGFEEGLAVQERNTKL